MRQRFCINVRGKSGRTFGFPFDGDSSDLAVWRAEGFDVDEVINTVPVWAASLGLTWLWCRVQDAWNGLRLW